ncbi:MAG: response regulator, partial [Oligoflexia bacterium]|nr:response regulator [Oligoflexia bacterium]
MFALDFNHDSVASFVATSAAKKIGYYNENISEIDSSEWEQDILSEFLNAFIGLTISEWDRLKFCVEIGNLFTSKDTSNLPFRDNKIQNSYEIIFHVQKGFFRLRIFFNQKKKNSPEKILIVDDSCTVRFALESGLKKEGLIVEEATNGLEAIEKHKSFAPDLTIIDLLMPKLGGLETISKIKNTNPNAKFIILSSAYKEEDVEKAKSLGVLFFISKPLYMNLVLETINKISSDS